MTDKKHEFPSVRQVTFCARTDGRIAGFAAR